MTLVILENDKLRLSVLPELGGKLGSLVGIEDGREHLLQPPEFERRPASYGAPFDQYDTSGFDECFPTVGACELPNGTELPDHGELWSVAWQVVDQSSAAVAMEARGKALPYVFRRQVTLCGNQVVLDYEIENTGAEPFPYLWSSHPLLAVEPGDRIVLPDGVRAVQVESSAGDRLSGDVPWNEDLSLLGPIERKWADKLFAGPLDEGWCTVAYSRGGSLTYSFPADLLPFVGLWICQGGWPGEGRKPHYTLALEPTTGSCDRLDQALERGDAKILQPGSKAAWQMTMTVLADNGGKTEAGV